MVKLIEKNYLGTHNSYDEAVEFLRKQEEISREMFSRKSFRGYVLKDVYEDILEYSKPSD